MPYQEDVINQKDCYCMGYAFRSAPFHKEGICNCNADLQHSWGWHLQHCCKLKRFEANGLMHMDGAPIHITAALLQGQET